MLYTPPPATALEYPISDMNSKINKDNTIDYLDALKMVGSNLSDTLVKDSTRERKSAEWKK
jgi:hypothetical protein